MGMRKTYKIIVLALICLLSSNGCYLYISQAGTSGDLGSVVDGFPLGNNREDVEDVLGSPDKKCSRTSNDEQIAYYYFDTGWPPNQPIAHNYLECALLTLGICDLFMGSLMMYLDGPNGLMTVVYDKNDIAVNYRKYSNNELAKGYGPKGYRPGIMDCEMISSHKLQPGFQSSEQDLQHKICTSECASQYVTCANSFDSSIQEHLSDNLQKHDGGDARKSFVLKCSNKWSVCLEACKDSVKEHDEEYISLPKAEEDCVWQFDSCFEWAGNPQQKGQCKKEKQMCLKNALSCDTNYSRCLKKVGRAISSERYCVEKKQKCIKKVAE